MNQNQVPNRRKQLQWKEADIDDYGDNLKSILAEFQAFNLESLGSTPIYSNKVKIGKKLKYVCKEEGCSFAARIIITIPSDKLQLETASKHFYSISCKSSKDEHNHTVHKNKFCPKKLAEALDKEPGKKPKELLKMLRKDDPIPSNQVQGEEEGEDDNNNQNDENQNSEQIKTDKQILQTIRSIKANNNAKGEIVFVDDLYNFFQDNQLSERRNNTEVFVIDALIENSQNPFISLVFSSRTCMKFLDYAMSSPEPMLAVDGTFKINSFGYPMLVLTTQDSKHQVYPIAFAPSSSECEKSVSFLLNSVIKAYKFLYKKDIKVNYFMSDCATYNYTSVSNTLGSVKHLSCFFSYKRSTKKTKISRTQSQQR